MKRVIIFDFDGVILDSVPVKTYGFGKIFERYPQEQVAKLLAYHEHNGGLSRFHKIRYFYREILGQNITEDEVQEYAEAFGRITKNELTKRKYLIDQTLQFIQNNRDRYKMHIASGAEHEELNYLCNELGIVGYFLSIEGSPTAKYEIVKKIITDNGYSAKECCLIGDSINDWEASEANGVDFIGFNNPGLKEKAKHYIRDFARFDPSSL